MDELFAFLASTAGRVIRILAGIALIVVVSMLAIRWLGGARYWMRVISSIPGIGTLVHWYGFAEFARVLRILLDQDVALPEALEVTSQAMSNANVAHTAIQLSAATASGQSLSASLAQDRQVPQFMVPIVRVGEEQNELSGALQVIGELFEGFMRVRSQLISSVAPPLMLLLIGGAAIALPFCLLLPLVSLITNLSQ